MSATEVQYLSRLSPGHNPAITKAGMVNTAPAATDSPIEPTVRSRSDSKVVIQGKEVRVTLTLNAKELQNPAMASDIFDVVQRHYFVTSPAAPIRTTLEKYSVLAGSLIQLQILYVFEQDVTTLNVRSTLYEVMPAGHQHMMSLRLNGTLHEAILDARTPEASFTRREDDQLADVLEIRPPAASSTYSRATIIWRFCSGFLSRRLPSVRSSRS